MVIIRSLQNDGTMITIQSEVLSDAIMPFPTGSYLGSITTSVEAGTTLGVIAGIIRQQAATVIEDSIRGIEMWSQLALMNLQE